MYVRHLIAALIISVAPVTSAMASGDAPVAPAQEWSFEKGPIGAFGEYDKAALQRGYKIYREVCASCHSMKRMYFRNLEALGYNESQIKNIASEYTVEDGPNDEGDMFERAALPSDHFVSPFANDKAAAFANGGATPPDLSLIIKARANGANYVYGLLNGYGEPPEGMEVVEGKHWNKYFPGHNISMAPPLSEGQVSYEDGSPETVEQYAHDLVQFLKFASDPHMEARKKAGFRVILFLLVFAGIMYRVKKKIWADVH
tara:strand:- start:4459 stop:5232 length:774 start_codon:yes stop_codon:yes gene_type:complete